MSNTGLFVISLDFELYWGMFDKVSLDEYGENIRGVHTAIPLILSLFKLYGIHATWATVGMLMCDSRAQLESHLPTVPLRPVYEDMKASSYHHIDEGNLGVNADKDPYHYGAHLVAQILATPHQELGSHTFSHYYALDGGKNSPAVFAADCDAFASISAQYNLPITSLVFPRNQTSPDALAVCKEKGIKAYRGNLSHFLYTEKKEAQQTNIFLRALRLIDAYLPVSGHNTYLLSHTKENDIANILGSRFLRPYSKTLALFEGIRIARIKNSMTYAAQHNEIFHLWWHPHNFGINRKENLQNLLELLTHYNYLKEKYGMQSASMKETATLTSSTLH